MKIKISKLVRTIITYDIHDDNTRDALVRALEKIGFQSEIDQSTMTNNKLITFRTLSVVNNLCKDPETNFSKGDLITIYASHLIVKEEKPEAVIIKKDYFYSPKENQFV